MEALVPHFFSAIAKIQRLSLLQNTFFFSLTFRDSLFLSLSPIHKTQNSYDQYAQAWDCGIDVPVGDSGESVRFFHTKGKDGVERVFVDHPSFLAKVWGKTGAKLYGSAAGSDYADNQARFALFCR